MFFRKWVKICHILKMWAPICGWYFFFLNGQILITSYQKQVIKRNGSNSISNNSKAKLLIQHNCREIYVFQIVLENILEHTSGHFPLWIS